MADDPGVGNRDGEHGPVNREKGTQTPPLYFLHPGYACRKEASTHDVDNPQIRIARPGCVCPGSLGHHAAGLPVTGGAGGGRFSHAKTGTVHCGHVPAPVGQERTAGAVGSLLADAVSRKRPAEMVKVSPTWKPQSLNAMRRLERVLKRNLLTRRHVAQGIGLHLPGGEARIAFFSGAPEANIVGATAAPCWRWTKPRMYRWTNLTGKLPPWLPAPMPPGFSGAPPGRATPCWRANCGLPGQPKRKDGIRRVFRVDADVVAGEVPAYGRVCERAGGKTGTVSSHGAHPVLLEEIERRDVLSCGRLGRVLGTHPPCLQALPGRLYARAGGCGR